MDNGIPQDGPGAPRPHRAHNEPFDRLPPELNERLDELRGRLDEVTAQAADFIRQRPGTSLLLAACAGYLLGRLVRA